MLSNAILAGFPSPGHSLIYTNAQNKVNWSYFLYPHCSDFFLTLDSFAKLAHKHKFSDGNYVLIRANKHIRILIGAHGKFWVCLFANFAQNYIIGTINLIHD